MSYNGEQSGAFLIDKPAGITSFDVIARVRKLIKIKQVGHTGTLDPMATGLLVVLFGKATKLQDLSGTNQKEYQGIISLGQTTDTDDVTGKIIEKKEAIFSEQEYFKIEKRITQKFIGKIEQIPPFYSAIKINGDRSYNLARNGITPVLKSRMIEIFQADYKFIAADKIQYSVTCSKGTYIRSLARDIGKFLGCGGTLESIRRTKSDSYTVSSAIPLVALEQDGINAASYLSLAELVESMPKLKCSDAQIAALYQGKQEFLKQFPAPNFNSANIAVVTGDNTIAGILDNDQLKGLRIRFMF